ncbi:hypothetical protein ASPWEDRAFT_166987 [Aspergillus wentii DTO 134E9]|uniref:Uncharacterized protein n=1 Tax=Aspergillus wentii DTO 134E9 TaxID=1073089 RepID=A0A1L9S1A4_ASPWE|nr:uncharacterized protein ASPWEDRAFT_166987 [Aspergillus wentii DTO 134E9]KAI9931062.1 hypothetical protein MW887_010719 [Aspergillus wentii]OJJ40942.1 hypothetical protein ASPWEDRAFT_166987 [Aspergillus wentii DTO 134E9]
MARVHTTENATFQEILEAVHKDCVQALEHPFAAVDTARELNPGLLNTLLNHRQHDTLDISLSDFELCVDEFDDGITSYLTYRERRVLPEMLKDFTHVFINCLSLVLANPDIKVTELATRARQ